MTREEIITAATREGATVVRMPGAVVIILPIDEPRPRTAAPPVTDADVRSLIEGHAARTSRPGVSVMLTSQEAAERLGVSEDTLSRWRITGYGPRFVKYMRGKKPGRVCYRSVDLEQFIESRLQDSTSSDNRGEPIVYVGRRRKKT